MDVTKSINRAIDHMPAGFEIAEVVGMLLTEYNEAEAMELFREEGLEEGLEKGREEGTLETLVALVRKGLLTVRQAAEQAQLSDAEFKVRAGIA